MLNTFSYIPRYVICFFIQILHISQIIVFSCQQTKEKKTAAQDVSLMKNIITLYEKKV